LKLRLLLLSCIFAISGAATNTAEAHLVRVPDHPQKSVIENRLNSQTENVKHAMYVCNHGKRETKTWHCKALKWLKLERAETFKVLHPPRPSSPTEAICRVFGEYCSQAIAVARCETGGTFSVHATNGQYLGLFQMGDYARSAYGHASDAWGQAVAAYRYFKASGSDWSPWQCRPYGLGW
jgi:hypothetical protein